MIQTVITFRMSVASIQEEGRYVVIKLGNDIHSVVVNYGYMEHPDVRNVLKELQRKKLLPIASERWIIEVGEEGGAVDHGSFDLKRSHAFTRLVPDSFLHQGMPNFVAV